MRLMIALAATAATSLALGACQVSKDEANDTVSVTYNGDVAENALADAADTAENVAADVSNGVDAASDRIENTDVDVSVDTNTQDGNAN
jgi:hypothetical protein